MLLNLSRLALYASIFSVVVVASDAFFPFITGKAVFFRIAVELALIFYLLSLVFENRTLTRAERRRMEEHAPDAEGHRQPAPVPALRLLRTPIVIAVAAFVLAFFVAGALGINPSYSFWSNFEREEGVFQMLHYFAFFMLLVLTMRTKKEWRNAFYVSCAAAALMIVYGIIAWFGVRNFIGPAFLLTNRFQGSLGNPAYMSVYLIFIFAYLGFLFMEEKNAAKKTGLAALGAFFFAFFMLAQTRGAFLGLGAGAMVFLASMAWMARGKTRAVSLALLAAVIAAGSLLIAFRNSEFVKKIPGGRVFEISVSDRTFQTRIWTWEAAIKGWKERPAFGWGPENFSSIFDKHFDTRHYVPAVSGMETWFDRAHSVFFDYLSEIGAVGLAAYLAVFVSFYIMAAGARNAGLTPALRALLVSVPVAYLVQGAVLFDVLPTYLNLFLFLAFANYMFKTNGPHQSV